MQILAITSHVVYGHVGGQAAILALQRLGHEVWHTPTVLFSNHPGHNGFRGEAVAPELLTALLDGVAERGWLADCAALHIGYLGAPETVDIVLQTIARTRAANPDLLVSCDPILGDAGRVYVADGILEAMRDRLLPQCDIVTPNAFELSLLTGRPVEDPTAAMADLHALGPDIVVCTSAATDDEQITTLLHTADAMLAVRAPAFSSAPHGTGDLFAALFLGRYLTSTDPAAALAHAAAATHDVIAASNATGAHELLLVDTQDRLVQPDLSLEIEKLR